MCSLNAIVYCILVLVLVLVLVLFVYQCVCVVVIYIFDGGIGMDRTTLYLTVYRVHGIILP